MYLNEQSQLSFNVYFSLKVYSQQHVYIWENTVFHVIAWFYLYRWNVCNTTSNFSGLKENEKKEKLLEELFGA